MRVYYLVWALSLIIQWILPGSTDKQYRWKLFFTFIPLFLFGALRVDFGNDYWAYERLFYAVQGSGFPNEDSSMEIGYQFLCHILPNFRTVLIINAFLLSLSLGVFIYRYVPKRYLWLAVTLVFLNPEKNIYGNLVGIRNGLVVTSFLLSYIFVEKRKWIPFFLITALLLTIHKSALLFLPIAYFLGLNKPMTRGEAVVWVIGSIVLLGVGMSTLVDMVSLLIDNEYFDQYEGYLEKKISRGWLLTLTSIILLVFFLVYLYKNRHRLTTSDNSIIRMGMWYSGTSFLGSLAMRAAYFYDMFFIAAVIKIVADKKIGLSFRLVLLALVIAMCCYSMFYVWMGKSWWNHGIYHSIIGSW